MLRISVKQSTDLMKFKKKKHHNVHASLLLIREKKTLKKGNTETRRGAGIKEKCI